MGRAAANKRIRQQQRSEVAELTFWHGGVAGLSVGSHLLSPALTHDRYSYSRTGLRASRPDRVYISTDRELARMYAAIVYDARRASALYRVVPIGTFEADPDFAPVSYQTKRALIVAVEELDVQLTGPERVQRSAPYSTWADGRPIYDQEGRIQLTWQLEARGVTQRQLDSSVKPWSTPEEMAAVFGGSVAR